MIIFFLYSERKQSIVFLFVFGGLQLVLPGLRIDGKRAVDRMSAALFWRSLPLTVNMLSVCRCARPPGMEPPRPPPRGFWRRLHERETKEYPHVDDRPDRRRYVRRATCRQRTTSGGRPRSQKIPRVLGGQERAQEARIPWCNIVFLHGFCSGSSILEIMFLSPLVRMLCWTTDVSVSVCLSLRTACRVPLDQVQGWKHRGGSSLEGERGAETPCRRTGINEVERMGVSVRPLFFLLLFVMSANSVSQCTIVANVRRQT